MQNSSLCKLRSRLWRLSFSCILLSALNACAGVREGLRETYNPEALVPGVTRQSVENQLGQPTISKPEATGGVTARYETSKIAESALVPMVTAKIYADVYTLGVAELINPFGLRDDTRAKSFMILYSIDDQVDSIELDCAGSEYGPLEQKIPIATDSVRTCFDGPHVPYIAG